MYGTGGEPNGALAGDVSRDESRRVFLTPSFRPRKVCHERSCGQWSGCVLTVRYARRSEESTRPGHVRTSRAIAGSRADLIAPRSKTVTEPVRKYDAHDSVRARRRCLQCPWERSLAPSRVEFVLYALAACPTMSVVDHTAAGVSIWNPWSPASRAISICAGSWDPATRSRKGDRQIQAKFTV